MFKVIGWFITYLVCMFAILAAAHAKQEDNGFTITVRHDRNSDPKLSYFRLASPDGTSVLVIGDDDLPIVRWLQRYDGARVRLQLVEQAGLQRLER